MKKKTGEEKENIGPCTMWNLWTAQKRVVDDDDAIDRVRKLALSAGTTEEAAQRTSSITSLLQLLPMDNEWSLHRFVAWLSGVSHHITWHPITFELTIDSVHKSKSNIADIITYLKQPTGNNVFYPSAHVEGTFVGIPLSMSHFIEVVGQELYASGFVKMDPHKDFRQHIKDVVTTLEKTFSLNKDKVNDTMVLSMDAHERMKIETADKIQVARNERKEKKHEQMKAKKLAEKVMVEIAEEEERKAEEAEEKLVNLQKSQMFEKEVNKQQRQVCYTAEGKKMKKKVKEKIFIKGTPQ